MTPAISYGSGCNAYERIVTLVKTYPSVTPIHELITVEPGEAGKYVTAPLYLDRKFDLIFIDGRMRTDCIAIARQVLNESGVVLVHDANRVAYHQAFAFSSKLSRLATLQLLEHSSHLNIRIAKVPPERTHQINTPERNRKSILIQRLTKLSLSDTTVIASQLQSDLGFRIVKHDIKIKKADANYLINVKPLCRCNSIPECNQ